MQPIPTQAFVDLADACNLRDLGGLETADGQVVRRGLLFRSASIHALTDPQRQTLQDLGITLVIDLRSRSEREHQPSQTSLTVWARNYEASGAELMRAWSEPGIDAARARMLMTAVYRSLVEEQAASYAELLCRIAGGDVPLLFHCTAGKDRTGIAAALILDLLGVSRATIETDYLHSSKMIVRSIASVRASLVNMGMPPLDDEVLAPILGTDPAYLDALFNHLDEAYGSVSGYVEQRLDVTPETVAQLKWTLLEPA